MQSRATTNQLPDEMRRWIRTLQFNVTDIDGNPNQDFNGGIVGLANSHAVGSLLNHSRDYAKTVYWVRDLHSPYLHSPDGTRVIGCVFIRAIKDIYKHEHLLINYEPHTAALIDRMLYFA